jgi:hypothetical protein
VAKSPTLEEFQDYVKEVQATLEAAVRAGKCPPPTAGWVWSWDNPRHHGHVEPWTQRQGKKEVKMPSDWAGMGITAANHAGLSRYSPDIHNVIEQAHHIICSKLQPIIDANPLKPVKWFLRQLQQIAKEELTPEWADKALRRLFATTLPGVIAAKGKWGPHGTR